MNRTSLLMLAAAWAGSGCASSSTAPWPPAGPIDGLPYIPLGEKAADSEGSRAPGPTSPAAMDSSLPASAPSKLDRSHRCGEETCAFPQMLPEPTFARAAPSGSPSPGALWLEDVAAGSTVTLPRHRDAELLAVVIGGTATAIPDEGGPRLELGQWSALRAPGAGLGLRAGEGGAKIVLALAAAKGTLDDVRSALAKPGAVSWKKRPAALSDVKLSDAKNHAWGKGAFHVRIAFGGEPAIPGSLETLLTSADAAIKEHDHPSWEHIAILQGEGTMRLGGADHRVEAGRTFDIPPGQKHAFTPKGTEPLVAVQMYTPSGAEQRFVKLAEAEAAASTEK